MKASKKFSINKKNNNLIKFLIGAIALLFLLFIINFFVSPIENYFYTISYPIQKVFWVAGESSSTFLGSLIKAGSLAKEVENLKIENEKLLSRLALLQSTEEGAEAQNQISAFCQNNGFKFVMAGVVGLEDNDVLSINKGSVDGISENMPVVNQQNVLVGKIFKVYKNFSKIMLISSKDSVINVKVQKGDDSEEIDGVVKGIGGLRAYLDLIPISNNIEAEDVLVTSAIEKAFPKDLLVGKIISKQKDDQNPFQQAQISLFFDIKASDNLFVITNYKR